MLGRTYANQNCSVARALEAVGERWSLLIIREALLAGSTRFGDFARSLGIAPNILTSRLDHFVADGLMARQRLSESTEKYEYVLTDKGRALFPTIVALRAWGDEWAAPDGPPTVLKHTECGGEAHQHVTCPACGMDLVLRDIDVRPG